MLTRRESLRIKQTGVSTLHDYWFNSLIAGEPHFEEGLLTYYDGRIATLCSAPLRNEAPVEDSICRRVAFAWVRDRGAEGLIFLGPRKVSLRILAKEGLRRIAEEKPRRVSAELLIDCTRGPGSVFRRRLYRRSRALEFQLTLRKGGIISAEHFRLVEMFYAERELTAYLAEVAFVLPCVLRSPRVLLIEARKNGRLSGFAAIHKPFSDTAVGLFMMGDRNVSGVCDFLYAVMLEQANRLGASDLNVGPSPSIGHFNFKVKWGGHPTVDPYYLVQWGRGSLARRFHTSWGPRLVRL